MWKWSRRPNECACVNARRVFALFTPPSTGSPLAICNGAIEGLTRSLALELGPRLRVNCFSPGFFDTERFDHMDPEKKAAMLTSTAASLPAQRVGAPEDAGLALHFLMQSAYTTGAILDVDGGHQVRQYATQVNDPMRDKNKKSP